MREETTDELTDHPLGRAGTPTLRARPADHLKTVASRTAEIRALASRANLEITDSQVRAVAAQASVYDSDSSPAAGLHHLALAGHAGGAVAARFHYLHRGLPASLGLEVTVFAAGGEPIDSQDFG